MAAPKHHLRRCGGPGSIHLALLTLLACPASAQVTTQVIALTGAPVPDGNGTLSSFGAPVLNDSGQAAFYASHAATSGGAGDDIGLYRSSGGPLVQMARTGQTVPGGNGRFPRFNSIALNNAGQVAFSSELMETSGGGTDDWGIFRGDGGAIVKIARRGDVPTAQPGYFVGFNDGPKINESGQVAFVGDLGGMTPGPFYGNGLYRGDGNQLVEIARDSQVAPGSDGSFTDLGGASLNNAGQVSFNGTVDGNSGGSSQDYRIYRSDGATTIEMARELLAAPDGNGLLGEPFPAFMNNAGQAAFRSLLYNTSGGPNDNYGIFRIDGVGSLTQIARAGQSVPAPGGKFGFFNTPAFNDLGEVAFVASLAETATSSNTGIFRSGTGPTVQIAREGAAVPGGNGQFAHFGTSTILVTLNDAGQVAFRADLQGTTGGTTDNRAVFLYDNDLGLVEIARKGDLVAGSSIVEIGFNPSPDNKTALNELGQVAYSFTLADGRAGIAVTSLTLGDADFNTDFQVDGADFLTWQRGLGLSGTAAIRAAGNADGNAIIDGADLAVWRGQFGPRLAAGATIAVPEPAFPAALTAIAMIWLLASHRGVGRSRAESPSR